MKTLQKISLLVIMVACLPGKNLGQTCTTCTDTVTALDTMPWVIPIGMKLCIDSGGTLMGNISLTGGELCNNGVINSANIAMITSSTLNNYGTVNSANLAIDVSSIFRNYGDATVTDIGMTTFGALENYNVFLCTDLASSSNSTIANDFDMTIGNMAISDTYFSNTGVLVVNFNFATSISDVVENSGSMHFKGNFVNSPGCTFNTTCMIQVDGDWTNSGTMTGPMTSCGGFNVKGISVNTGSFATDNSNLDICDTTAIFGGFDAPGGTVGNNVTNCVCSNTCSGVLGDNETGRLKKRLMIYPNPSYGNVILEFENEPGKNYFLKIFDQRGRTVLEESDILTGKIIIDGNRLAKGLYLLQLSDNFGILEFGKFGKL